MTKTHKGLRNKYIRLISLLVAAVVIGGMLIHIARPKEAEAVWYDDNYPYREKITIGNTGSADSNKKVKLDIDTATQITNEKMQSDCDDTRFTDFNGRVLKYYLDSAGGACNSASTDYYVLLPTINGGNASYIYMYHGNPTSVSGSQSAQFSESTFSPTSGPTVGSEEKGQVPSLYWKLDEGSGATAEDSSSGGNDGTITGATRKPEDLCRWGKCVTLDGTDDVITRADDSDLDFAAADNFTIQTWIKHGVQSSGQDVIVSKQEAGSSATTKIDDAGNPGGQPSSGRQVVRTSTGTLYASINDGGSCEIWKSTNGSSWTEQDAANNPSCNSLTQFAIAIDSTNTIHAGYISGVSFNYVTFSTGTDTFGGAETIGSTSDYAAEITIAVDSNDKPHTVFTANDVFDGFNASCFIYYSNRVPGTWSVDQIDSTIIGGTSSCSSFLLGSIAISEDNIPEIAYIFAGTGLVAVVGNQNDPTGFSNMTVDATVNETDGTQSTSIGIDSSGNTWIAYKEATTGYAALIKHNDADAWSTWQSPVTNSNVGNEPSIVINSTDIYIFYSDELNDIKYDRYNGSTWIGETNLETGTYSDTKARWSFNHLASLSTYGIDYVFSDGTDVYWHNLALSGGGGGSGSDGIGYKVVMESDGDLTFGIDDDATSFPEDSVTSTAATYDDDKWHLITAVKTGTTSISLYIDGNLIGTDSTISATGTLANTGSLYVGLDRDASSNPYAGFIDEFKIYKYARSVAQMKADYINGSAQEGAAVSFGQSTVNTLANGLVAYWRLDESAANSCTGGTNDSCDATGNGLDGAWSGNSASAAGKYGPAVTFDGTDDFISMSNPSALQITGEITVSAWVNTDDASTYQNIFGRNAAGQVNYYSYTNDNNTFGFSINDEAWVDGTTTYSTNSWYHIVGTYIPSKSVRLYVNGKLEGEDTSSVPSSIDNFSQDFVIGGSAGGSNDFDGEIDDVKVYSRALSDSEALALYESAPPPVGYWNLDERSGTTAVDSSLTGNTGTLTNGPIWINGKIGGATQFDATNDYISVADSSSLDLTDAVTTEAWIKPTADGNSTHSSGIVVKGTSTDGNSGSYEMNMGSSFRLRLRIYTTSAPTCDSPNNVLALNTWSHVALRYDRTALKAFVNGVEVCTASHTLAMEANNGILGIGVRPLQTGSSSTSQFPGYIDDVKVYNYARTNKQIVEDMNASHPSVGTPVGAAAGHWSFDEGYGTTANDKSPNSNSLTSGGVFSTTMFTNSGKFGKAWNGNSANWLSRADDSDFDFAAGEDFTISTWIKSDSASNPAADEYILSKETSSAGYALYITTTGEVRGGIDDDATSFPEDLTETNNDIYDATWHHIVLTKTSSSLSLYLDGKLKDTDLSLSATGSLANSDSLTLGDRNATNDTDDFVGDIDETKIYRFALNSDEVKIEYNQGKAEVLGALSTTSNGTTSDNSSDRSYCIPGDTTTCTAPSGEWKLDENTGTTAQDTSTNGFSGTLSNGPTYAQGKIGSAVSFDGSNDLIELADQATLDVGVSDNLSISAWVYRSNTTADQQIVSKKLTASVGDVGYTLYQYSTANGGNTCVYISDGTDQSEACTNDNTTTTLNTWEHVAFTFDNSTNVITIYQNGRDATHAAYTVTDTVDSAANSICARIGSAGLGATCNGADSTHNFIGKIDQVRIYKAALSSAQIAWDYNRAKAVGYWKLDDCTGTTVNDSSGNSNTGTITAGAGGNTSAGSCSSGTSTEMWNDGTTGKFNSSLGFDGSDDTVNAGSGTSLDALTNKSVTAWINAASFGENSYGRIVDKGTDPSSSSGWGLFVCNSTNCSGNNLAFFHDFSGANDGWWTTPTNSISTGSWIHVAVTYNNSSASNDPVIYINGESKTITESITPAGTASDDSATSLFIGNRSAGDRTFDGSIDDVRVYNYILNSRQIKQVYNEGATARFGPASGQP